MAARVSIKGAARVAQAEERRAAKAWVQDVKKKGSPDMSGGPRTTTFDSFQNFLAGMGMGTDNVNSANYYGFNPITRNRLLCEWIHRGSWVGGVAVELVAHDMTRSGIEHPSTMEPDDIGKMDRAAKRLDVWSKITDCVKWGRLYGGAVCVLLIDGQDMSTPLKIDTVGKDQFKGLLTLDRWMLEPSLEDLVTDLGPHLGLPKFYRVLANAPALRGVRIHHTRIAIRHCGVKLPFQQQMMENLWGLSIFERLYDRLTAFDMATTGAAQLINKAYIRTMKIKDLRQIVAAGGQALIGLMSFMSFVRRTQGIEGITLLDMEDEYEAEAHGAFSGLDAIVLQFAQQCAGALQIPMVRLMGQSPGGLNATGEGDERIYYDNLAQSWELDLSHGVQTVYQCIAHSEQIKVPDDFEVSMAPLDQLTDTAKADVAGKDADTITKAREANLISDQVAMQELKQSSRRTGRFTNITQKMIDAAEDQIPAAPTEMELMEYQAALKTPADGDGMSGADPANPKSANDEPVPGAEEKEEDAKSQQRTARPNGKTGSVDTRSSRRRQLFIAA